MRYDTGVCEKDTPFVRAVALQCSSRNHSPPSDLVFSQLVLPRVFLSGGFFFVTDTGSMHEADTDEALGRLFFSDVSPVIDLAARRGSLDIGNII